MLSAGAIKGEIKETQTASLCEQLRSCRCKDLPAGGAREKVRTLRVKGDICQAQQEVVRSDGGVRGEIKGWRNSFYSVFLFRLLYFGIFEIYIYNP